MADTRSPGWYPAPDGNGQQWWNGVGWSETRQGGTHPVTAAPPLAPVQAPVPVTPAKPPVYSAQNPPPLRPDPYGRPAAALTSRTINASVNRNAMIGFILGIAAIFFNLLFVVAPIAIVFSILGLNRARQLKTQGVTNTLALFAWIGLLLGVISAIVGAAQVIAFIVSIASFNVDVSAMFPASGILPWVLAP